MNWKKVNLGDVCEVIAGQSPPSSTYNTQKEGLPFFQGKTDFGDIFPKVRIWCNQPNKTAYPGDILLSVRAPVGPTNICDVKSAIGRGLAAVRSNGKTNNKFIYYYFKLIEPKLSASGNGSTFSAITTGDVKELEIPLPPLPTQQRIAAILDEADALRKADAQLLAKYDELLQASFLELLGDPVRNEKGWEIRKFGSVFKSIRYGTSIPPKYISEGIPFIRATNIKGGEIVDKGMVYISSAEAETIKKCFVNEGDLILVRSGVNTGDCARVNTKHNGSLAGYDLIIEIDEPYSVYYSYLINSEFGKKIIKPLSRRAAQPHLNAEQAANLEFLLPPSDVLSHFTKIIFQLDEQKNIIRQQQQQSEALFQSLLQKAFKGEL